MPKSLVNIDVRNGHDQTFVEVVAAILIDPVTGLPSSGGGVLPTQLPETLGTKTAVGSLSVTPASDANVARESYSTVTIVALATAGSGTGYVTFGSLACTSLDIINNTGTDIEVRRGGAGSTLIIRDGYSRLMQGISNANAIQLRRKDLSVTPVTVSAEGYAV